MIASTGSLRFVDELVGLDRLLGHGPAGVLEDLAFSASHIVGRLERLADLLAVDAIMNSTALLTGAASSTILQRKGLGYLA
jgi:hypothetical protein